MADQGIEDTVTIPRTMHAARHNGYGPVSVLEIVADQPVPTPGPGELLIRNRATSVNPIDSAVRSGYGAAYWEHTGQVVLPHIPGRDVVGAVVAAGPGVSRFAVGDEVWAGTFSGGTAEYVAVMESWAAPRPRNLTDIEAASLPYVALTAWTALVSLAGITPENAAGKKIIIPRGAGGVGNVAIQVMKAWGAHVATFVSPKNIPIMKALGVDVVVDRTSQDFADVLHDYDVVLDSFPGLEQKLLGTLKVGGDAAYVSIVTPKLQLIDKHGIAQGQALGETVFAERVAAQQALGRRYYWSFMEPDGAALGQIGRLVEAGAVRPLVDRVYRLDQLAQAHAFIDTKQVQGKVVIDIAARP
jgi:NADPH:quinone reductase-like Zn-dependent oxidoreductase